MFIQNSRAKLFKVFTEFVSYNELEDSDVDKIVFAKTSSLVDNSANEIQPINKTAFDQAVQVNKVDATKKIN